MGINLSQFIKNLENFKDNPMKTLTKNNDTLYEIIYAVLYQMAYYTRPDTSQARYLIISKFAEKLGRNYDDLKDEYYHWVENKSESDRGWGENSENSTMSENLKSKNYNLKISIKDTPLYNQEMGEPGSSNHPRNENYSFHFFPRHLTYVSDLMNDGNYKKIYGLNWDKIINKIIEDIENELFK